MRIVPVLDLKAGLAVHAVAGRREHYQPLRSILHEGSDPIALATAYRDALGLNELYLADLDAIAGSPPSVPLYRSLATLGLTLWIDAGVADAGTALSWSIDDRATIVVGLESVREPAALGDLVATLGSDRLVFSLDLREGLPVVSPFANWESDEPLEIAEAAVGIGFRRLLILDLARVGTGRGAGAVPLLLALRALHPDLEISVGGGVRGPADLRALDQEGASAVLVGSALHDGRIGAGELAERP